MELENQVYLIKQLEFAFRKLRIEQDLEYHKAEYEKRTPDIVGDSEGAFAKFKKNTKNNWNKGGYEKHLALYNELKEKLASLEAKAEEENKGLIPLDYLQPKIKEAFENDKYGIGKLEFAMSIVLDNTIAYECNSICFKRISILLGYDEEYLKNLESELRDGYMKIALTNYNNLKTAGIVAGVIAIPILLIGNIGLTATALASAASKAALGSILFDSAFLVAGLCISTALYSGAAFGISYLALDAASKAKIRNEFKKLSVEETAMSLV